MSIVPFLIHGRFFEEEGKRPYEKVYEATTGGDMNERIMGYPIKDLLVLVESLRLTGIRVEELHDHIRNIEFAFKVVQKTQEEALAELVREQK